MTWIDLTADVHELFSDAQTVFGTQLRNRAWAQQARRLEQKRADDKRRKLLELRKRLRGRAVIECGNRRCRVSFVPYNARTLYCSPQCCARYNAWRRRQTEEGRAQHRAEQRRRMQRLKAEGRIDAEFVRRKRRAKYHATPPDDRHALAKRKYALDKQRLAARPAAEVRAYWERKYARRKARR
jgi:hypothetical protein